jgi:F-type H+-transporting ATPase subunit delta
MNLAYKYANAFLNVYNDRLNFENIKSINNAVQFLPDHRRALFLLQVPIITQAMKKKWVAHFCERFDLIDPLKDLIILLLHHKRAFLLIAVLKAIVDCYQKRHHIENIVVKSSVPLPEKYRQDIERFMNQHIMGIQQYHYKVDPTLIAGIRIQSDTVLWECSMKKRLRDIAHANSCEEIWKKIQI